MTDAETMGNETPSDSDRRAPVGSLFLLCLIGFLNSVDAKIIGVVAEPIKMEFRLSDTELGILTGFAFSLCYAAVSLPIARWSDKGNRAAIIAMALAFWSMMTALCGLSNSYLKLVMARTGVAVGESAFNPAAYSLIADYFGPARRARAMAALSVAASLGTLASFTAGGLVAQIYGWRAVFLALGLPGIFLTMIVWFQLREPDSRGTVRPPDESLWQGLGQILRSPGYLLMTLGGAALSFTMGTLLVWSASLFERVYHWPIADIGMPLGLLFGFAGMASPLATTYLGDLKIHRQRTAYVDALLWLSIIGMPLVGLGFLVQDPKVSLIVIAAAFALASGWIPCILATIRMNVDPRQMAMATAIVGLSANLVGLGAGPLVIGAISDTLAADLGEQAIRYALCFCSLAFLVAIVCFATASRILRSCSQPV